MRLAYTMAPGRGDTDLVLSSLASDLVAQGLNVAGTVQINTERADAGPCDMDVKVLPQGPVLRISQDLGLSSRGCRLDPSALETAVGLVSTRLDASSDLLIINKFGKHEAEGRGFRDVIADALVLEVPVLVGINGLNKTAFEAFADGFAVALPPEPVALASWVQMAVSERLRRPELECA